MNQSEMIRSLRAEITNLQRVLDLLLDQQSAPDEVKGLGRPKGTRGRDTSTNREETVPAKRTMSAEGKARIAAAQKKRWAAQKRASASVPAKAKPSTAKQAMTAKHSKPTSKAVKSARTGQRPSEVPAKVSKVPAKRKATAKGVTKKRNTEKATR